MVCIVHSSHVCKNLSVEIYTYNNLHNVQTYSYHSQLSSCLENASSYKTFTYLTPCCLAAVFGSARSHFFVKTTDNVILPDNITLFIHDNDSRCTESSLCLYQTVKIHQHCITYTVIMRKLTETLRSSFS